MPPTETTEGPSIVGNIGMIFIRPWNAQGYVPGERAGFSPETCRALYDAGLARYIDPKLNVMNLGADVIAKIKNFVLGQDAQGAPVQQPEPSGWSPGVHPQELASREPEGSPAGKAPPPPPSVAPTHVSAASPSGDGTQWPPAPSAGDAPAEESARPEELVGRKKR